MRNALTILGFLALSGMGVFGQAHVPLFGEPTRTWTSEFSGTIWADCMDHWTTTYWIAGDTAIGGTDYTVIRNRTRHWLSTITAMYCTTSVETEGQPHFIREEDQRVFLFIDTTEDRMIYDFTVEVGDSIPFPSNFPTNNSWLDENNWIDVVAIDSVEIDGTFRKRFIVEDIQELWDTVSVVEGIGGSHGPFQPLIHQIGLSHGVELHCVREHGAVIYGSTFCMLITSLSEASVPPSSAPYPNPASDLVTLDQRVMHFEVIDATGRSIVREQGQAVDLSELPEGIYSIRGLDLHGHWVGTWPVILMNAR